jgi:hypothetical protein
MGAVAIRGIGGSLAAAEVKAHRFTHLQRLGPKFGSIMGSVAERLGCGFSAGTPEISLTGFEIDLIVILASNLWLGHALDSF